jgi:hypothetical protein
MEVATVWEAILWTVYGLSIGIFVLWCILPAREFLKILKEHRKSWR